MPRSRSLLPAIAALAGALAILAAIALLVQRAAPQGPPQDDAPSVGQARTVRDAARAHLAGAEPAKAAELLRALLAADPEDADAHALLAETLLLLDQPRAAYDHYLAAIAVGPAHAELHFAAGALANTIAMPDRALEHYHAAQQADPTNPKHPLYLAQVQRKLGLTDEAKASLIRAARLDPSLAIAWGVLADIALEENNLSVASTHIARAREAEPDGAAWRIIEARILRRQNRPEDAARLLAAMGDEALADSPAALEELATSYAMLGLTEQAASVYVRASAARPRSAELAYSAAVWLERAGRPDDAETFARAADRMGHPPAADLIVRLRSRQPD